MQLSTFSVLDTSVDLHWSDSTLRISKEGGGIREPPPPILSVRRKSMKEGYRDPGRRQPGPWDHSPLGWSLLKPSQEPKPESASPGAQQTEAAILLPKVRSSSTLSMCVGETCHWWKQEIILRVFHWPYPPHFSLNPDPSSGTLSLPSHRLQLALLCLLNHCNERPSSDKQSN